MERDMAEDIHSRSRRMLQRLRERDAQLAEAAAFLDGLASHIDSSIENDFPIGGAAADCRAMAKKLRGEHAAR